MLGRCQRFQEFGQGTETWGRPSHRTVFEASQLSGFRRGEVGQRGAPFVKKRLVSCLTQVKALVGFPEGANGLSDRNCCSHGNELAIAVYGFTCSLTQARNSISASTSSRRQVSRN